MDHREIAILPSRHSAIALLCNRTIVSSFVALLHHRHRAIAQSLHCHFTIANLDCAMMRLAIPGLHKWTLSNHNTLKHIVQFPLLSGE